MNRRVSDVTDHALNTYTLCTMIEQCTENLLKINLITMIEQCTELEFYIRIQKARGGLIKRKYAAVKKQN